MRNWVNCKPGSRCLRLSCALLLFAGSIAIAADFLRTTDATVRPTARAETQPVPHKGDAADDPAIWIHPTSPESSLILGTDKQGALHTYDMNGASVQTVGEGSMPNNVDVLYGFALAGRTLDLAVAATRGQTARGIKIWSIDPETRRLAEATEGGTVAVLNGGTPYGCCTYRSARSGKSYVFVSSRSGLVEQYELQEIDGRVGGRLVATLSFATTVEACVADDELGFVYFGEENRGVWKYAAEPTPERRGTLIAKAGEHGLKRDVEGLAIYFGRQGSGYLIASSQGNNTFKIYERGGDNRFVLTINPKAGRFGDVEETDGIAVTSQPSSRMFSKGLFIAQDGKNSPTQNFKLFAWEDIAGTNLLIDTSWSPRRR